MRTPSWVELVGRNVAAGAMSMSGSLRVFGSNRQDNPIDERFEFWHGGGGQWRIERDGKVVYIAADEETSLVLVEGEMRRQHAGRIRLEWLGSMFSPLDLLGERSLLNKMSSGMRVVQETKTVETGGRSAWSTTLASPKTDDRVELAFDDVTGLLVYLRSPQGGVLLDVTDLAVHDQIDSERFTWDGPVVDVAKNDPRVQAAERIEILAALVTAFERPNDLLEAISDTSDREQASTAVMELFGITEIGAHAVLSLQIRRFSVTEMRRIERELAELRGLAFDTPQDQS